MKSCLRHTQRTLNSLIIDSWQRRKMQTVRAAEGHCTGTRYYPTTTCRDDKIALAQSCHTVSSPSGKNTTGRCFQFSPYQPPYLPAHTPSYHHKIKNTEGSSAVGSPFTHRYLEGGQRKTKTEVIITNHFHFSGFHSFGKF
jgi:hypothetical protein